MSEEQTINSEVSAPSTETPVVVSGGELKSTVEFVEKAVSTQTPASDQKTDDNADKAAADTSGSRDQQDNAAADKGSQQKAADDNQRFDKHPRFQQLISTQRDLQEQLAEAKRQIAALSESRPAGQQPQGGKETKSAFDGIDDEALFERLNNKPKEFLAELAAQIKADTIAEFSQQAQAEQAKQRTISEMQRYADEHGDTEDGRGFDQMWNAGEIQKYIQEHPGHNAISAHMMLTVQDRIKAETEKAVNAVKEQITKQQTAKRNAATISGGPASSVVTGGPGNAELSDTRKQGGLTSVLAARLTRLRAGT